MSVNSPPGRDLLLGVGRHRPPNRTASLNAVTSTLHAGVTAFVPSGHLGVAAGLATMPCGRHSTRARSPGRVWPSSRYLRPRSNDPPPHAAAADRLGTPPRALGPRSRGACDRRVGGRPVEGHGI